MKLTKAYFNYEYYGIDNKRVKWELANHPRYTNGWYMKEAEEIRDQIVKNYEIVERLKKIKEFVIKVGWDNADISPDVFTEILG